MKPKFQIARLALVSAIAFSASARAASLTWNTASLPSGGSWDTVATNLAWNPGPVAWTQTNNTTATNTAIFGVADGTYAISVGGPIATQGIAFQNSGYTLSAASAQTITLNLASPAITTTTGKTADIGNNLTISTTPASGNPITIAGGGTLNISGAATKIQTGSNNLTLSSGPIVNLTSGASIISNGSFVIGTSTLNTLLTVDGGSIITGVASATGAQNIVIANAGTGIASTLTLKSGSVTNVGVNPGTADSGLRFGSTSISGSVSANLNLDGGTLTVARLYEGNATATLVSTVNLNGGTLKVTPGALNAANFMTGLDSVNVKEGGAVIDTNNIATTIAQPLLHGGVATIDGGLNKKGLGTLTLTGANSYTGATTIDAGKIGITAPYASLTATTINANARLRVTTAATASVVPSITVNTDGGLEANVGTYTIGQLSGLSTSSFNAAGNYKVDLAGSAIPTGDITVLTYTGGNVGSGLPSLGSVPPGVTGTVEDTGSAIVIHVDTPQAPSYVWSAGTGDWDTTTANWTGSTYTDGSVVTFPDLAGYNVVNLTANRSPFSTTISNASGSTYKLIGSAIAGTGTLTKSSTGAAILAAGNTYSGLTSVTAGGLLVGSDNALGSTAAGTSVASGAFLGLTGGVSYAALELVIGSGVGNLAAITSELNNDVLTTETLSVQRGFIQSSTGNNTFAGPVEIKATGVSRIGVQDGAQLTLSGAITQSPSVTGVIVLIRGGVNDGDSVTLSNSGNSWDGETRIFAGNTGSGAGLKLGVDNGLPVTTSVVAGGVSSGAGNSFDLNGFDQTLDGLINSNGTLRIVNNGTSASTLTLNPIADRDSSTVLSTMTTINDGTEEILLVKNGSFKQTLQGTHTYSGATTINAGTLALTSTATIDNSASIAIGAGATFDVSTKASYSISASQPVTLKLDGTGTGSAGRIKAAALDISTAAVTLDVVNPLDDAVYILADYTANSLTGTQFAFVNSIPGYTIKYDYNNDTQIALVKDVVPGFASWITGTFANGQVPGGQQGPNDDPDNDGVDNLLEFVLNGDPTISDSATLPDLTVGATTFVFTYQRRDDSLSPETTQTFEWGTTLATWPGSAVVPPTTGPVDVATVTVTPGTPDDNVTDTVEISIPKSEAGAGGKLFGRLQVTQP